MLNPLFTVLVNWNLKQDTIDCIRSLLAAGLPLESIVVVDNGSTDGSVTALAESFGHGLLVVESGVNLGFGAGCNLGTLQALRSGARTVFFLNNDTIVSPHLLAEFERADDEDFGVLAPLILEHHRPDHIWYLGDRRIGDLPITRSLLRGRPLSSLSLPPLVEVDSVTGCGMLVRRQVIEEIGLFDTSFFMYGEDADFCWRVRTAGFRIAAATRARIWHKVSASSRGKRDASRYLRFRNQIRFYRINSRASWLPMLAAFTLIRAARLAVGDISHHRTRQALATAHGWIDGWCSPILNGQS